jgi:SulP family sulfate permease
VILRLRNMTALDATGLHAIEQFAYRLHTSGRTLLLCGAREQPARLLAQSKFVDCVGRNNILPHVHAAIERALKINADSEAARSSILSLHDA